MILIRESRVLLLPEPLRRVRPRLLQDLVGVAVAIGGVVDEVDFVHGTPGDNGNPVSMGLTSIDQSHLPFYLTHLLIRSLSNRASSL